MEMQGGRALLVDDDLVLLRSYARVLTAAKHTVLTASCGEEALKLFHSTQFDAVFSDVSMPDMTGLDLAQAIHAQDPDVPVVLITGTPLLETAARAVEVGALRYLTKPVDADELCAIMRLAMAAGEQARRKSDALVRERSAADSGERKVLLEQSFEQALGALWMAYQPIVSFRNAEVVAHEALVRTKAPGVPHAGAFIELATQLGKLEQLGRTVRRAVAQKIADSGHSGTLFVNLHPLELLDELLYTGADPLTQFASQITLEITERGTLDYVTDLPRRIVQLRELGYRIAIDDLGAGYSGLASFAILNPDIVKLDMSLIRDIHLSRLNQRLVKSITDLCHEMELLVVAEGVETTEERDMIDQLGCDLMQGYLFQKPHPEICTVTF